MDDVGKAAEEGRSVEEAQLRIQVSCVGEVDASRSGVIAGRMCKTALCR
jgi:hypothetical protein